MCFITLLISVYICGLTQTPSLMIRYVVCLTLEWWTLNSSRKNLINYTICCFRFIVQLHPKNSQAHLFAYQHLSRVGSTVKNAHFYIYRLLLDIEENWGHGQRRNLAY